MKKFLLKLSYTVLPIWLILVAVTGYLSLYVIPQVSGDIGRLACIPFGLEYNKMLEKNMKKEIMFRTITQTEDLKSLQTDVLTIGDSFSQQQYDGYQNYLSEKGLDVVNCFWRMYESPLQYAYNLLDKNIIDSTKVKILILELVEREFETRIERFDKNKIEVQRQYSEDTGVSSNSWSLSRARDYILYQVGWVTPIYKEKLDMDLFTSDKPRDLYFFRDDIEMGVSIRNGEKVKQVYDILQEKAKEKGVRLLVMIAADKYDIYQNHIVDNPFPVKTNNEDIERIIGRSTSLLLTKQCLLPFIDKEEKDIYMFNDTHWSYKASKIIADELYQRITRNEAGDYDG